MDFINSSSIKESLYDSTDPDQYGVIKSNTKKDCVDVGNSQLYALPSTSLESKIGDSMRVVSSQGVHSIRSQKI